MLRKKLISQPNIWVDLPANGWRLIRLKDVIAAAGDTLKEIAQLVTRSVSDKTPDDRIPAAFKVPRKDEGPYIL